MVIDIHKNPKQKVQTEIPQELLMSPILFLIYISGMFSQIEEKLSGITYVSFVNNLGFLRSGHSISIVGKLLEKTGKIAPKWGANNLISYDKNKIEAMLLSKVHHQKLTKQIFETQLGFSRETISFYKKATRWLEV